MGVVFRAYDPSLDRKVAIKLLRTGGWDRAATEALRVRLQREAQAMARLSHPNVLPVHDIGQEGAQLFLAMELVEGGTLRDWLRKPRTWREVLAAYRAAGRGLAAAHEAGLVHRDFKPDNVLVGADGRVRVTDFGLVRLDAGAIAGLAADDQEVSAPGRLVPEAPDDRSALLAPMTRAGTLLGTPLYMAPEQLKGRTTGAATDQFSFCASVWEALAGAPPFQADSTPARLARIEKADPGPSDRRRMPLWLRRALLKGLRADPAARYPSMRQLLVQLGRDPWMRLRPWVFGGAAAALVVAGAAWMATAPRRAASSCAGASSRLAGAWDAQRRAAVEARFRGLGAGWADSAAARTLTALDRFAADWAVMWTASCEATRKTGEQSQELYELRAACLDQQRRELRAFVDLLPALDAAGLQRAPQAAASLGGLAACADVRTLRAAAPAFSAEQEERLAPLRELLAQARALGLAGQNAEAQRLLGQARAQGRSLGVRALEVDATLRAGWLAHLSGELELARSLLHEGVALALSEGLLLGAATGWTQLVLMDGTDLGRYDEARRWAAYADAALRAAGEPSGEARSDLESARAWMAALEGKLDEALARAQEAERAAQRNPVPVNGLKLANVESALAAAYTAAGRGAEALPHVERSLARVAAALGEDNPHLGAAVNQYANALSAAGRAEEALAQYRRAERLTTPLGDSNDRSMVLGNLGLALGDLGRTAEGIPFLQEALAMSRRVLGERAPATLHLRGGLGSALSRVGRHAEARRELEAVLDAREARSLDPTEEAGFRVALGQTLWALGDRGRSLLELRQGRDGLAGRAEEDADAKKGLGELEAWARERKVRIP